MKIKIEILVDDVAEAQDVMARLAANAVQPKAALAPEAPARGAKPTLVNSNKQAKVEPSAAVQEPKAAAPAVDAEAQRAALRPAVNAAVIAKGGPAVAAVFAKYGAAKLSGLNPSDFAAFEADLKAL